MRKVRKGAEIGHVLGTFTYDDGSVPERSSFGFGHFALNKDKVQECRIPVMKDGATMNIAGKTVSRMAITPVPFCPIYHATVVPAHDTSANARFEVMKDTNPLNVFHPSTVKVVATKDIEKDRIRISSEAVFV